MKVSFFSIASGSSGNCYFLSCDGTSILIDAGVGIRTIKKVLKERNIMLESINAVLITHDHADHIKSAAYLGEKCYIPVYATEKVHNGINASYCSRIKIVNSARIVEKNKMFHIGNFNITAFEVPHDASENVGYLINAGNVNFVFLTDLGEITPEASYYAQQADYLVIEANYDLTMLEMGPYPRLLKERIKSRVGHLCNNVTASFLADNFNGKLKHVWLCHVSKDNNHPELAYKTVEMTLQASNIIVGEDVELTVLRRHTPSEIYVFEC